MGGPHSKFKLTAKFMVGSYVNHPGKWRKFGFIYEVSLEHAEPIYGVLFEDCKGWFCESELEEAKDERLL